MRVRRGRFVVLAIAATLFVQAQNLTNRANYLGYSGTVISPFFGRPTTVSGMRKIDVGLGLNF